MKPSEFVPRERYDVRMPFWLPLQVQAFRICARGPSARPNEVWKLIFEWVVPDSRTGEPGRFGREVEVRMPAGKRMTRERIAEICLRELAGSFEHEVRENLLIDDLRAFPSPHVRRKRR